MKSNTMKYILTCIGDYKNNQSETILTIANGIMPMVTSPTVKYYNNDFNIIYHFESETPFEKLKLFIDEVVTPYVGMYFLNSCTPNMSLGMPEELYEYLFNLNDDGTTPPNMSSITSITSEFEVDEEFINTVKEISDQIFSDMEEMGLMDDSDDDLAQIVRKSKKKDEVPTLDNLLDKINKSGIGSLSKEEKTLLEQYSK